MQNTIFNICAVLQIIGCLLLAGVLTGILPLAYWTPVIICGFSGLVSAFNPTLGFFRRAAGVAGLGLVVTSFLMLTAQV